MKLFSFFFFTLHILTTSKKQKKKKKKKYVRVSFWRKNLNFWCMWKKKSNGIFRFSLMRKFPISKAFVKENVKLFKWFVKRESLSFKQKKNIYYISLCSWMHQNFNAYKYMYFSSFFNPRILWVFKFFFYQFLLLLLFCAIANEILFEVYFGNALKKYIILW